MLQLDRSIFFKFISMPLLFVNRFPDVVVAMTVYKFHS